MIATPAIVMICTQVYWVGPLLGALVAAELYRRVWQPPPAPAPVPAARADPGVPTATTSAPSAPSCSCACSDRHSDDHANKDIVCAA